MTNGSASKWMEDRGGVLNASSAINEALGIAMMRWQHVESSLYVVAHCLMRTDYETSSTCFFLIRSADQKLNLCSKLIHNRFGDVKENCPEWRAIARNVEDAVKVRNGMAHFELGLMRVSDVNADEFELVLTPHHLDPGRLQRDGTSKMLSSAGLRENADGFLELAKEILHFTKNRIPGAERRIRRLPPVARDWIDPLMKQSVPDANQTAPKR
ncbi:hypothetical protein [Jiella marina]|uniref:hypothetical protein n=1 Tax=Jiella sp. LLJ827 TaxID=2917712 RepID=UPI002101AE96|nr:hypothetical protein [Jiella sp. LLJ827]MCQ0986031.1 hypothetical protein [Jiella sp. LLJ827]